MSSGISATTQGNFSFCQVEMERVTEYWHITTTTFCVVCVCMCYLIVNTFKHGTRLQSKCLWTIQCRWKFTSKCRQKFVKRCERVGRRLPAWMWLIHSSQHQWMQRSVIQRNLTNKEFYKLHFLIYRNSKLFGDKPPQLKYNSWVLIPSENHGM